MRQFRSYLGHPRYFFFTLAGLGLRKVLKFNSGLIENWCYVIFYLNKLIKYIKILPWFIRSNTSDGIPSITICDLVLSLEVSFNWTIVELTAPNASTRLGTSPRSLWNWTIYTLLTPSSPSVSLTRTWLGCKIGMSFRAFWTCRADAP